MFPVEKTNILHTIARGATGGQVPEGSVRIGALLDESTLDKIAESVGSKIWYGFITFGSASAGILAIFVIIKIIKTIIDTIIQGYSLYEVYGCGFHLLGALWSSITHLLLQKSEKPGKGEQKEEVIYIDFSGKQKKPEPPLKRSQTRMRLEELIEECELE